MIIADSSFHTLGEMVSFAGLLLILVGCVLLHLRLRTPASLSLLIALGATALWTVGGQTMMRDLLAPPYLPSPVTETPGNNAQTALDALGRVAPAENAVIVGDTILLLWTALSFVLAVASIHPRPDDRAKLEDRSPR